MEMPPITTSVFDLFKIGPGPSSSHTIGPMKAALDFRQCLQKLPEFILSECTHIEVRLYGSLSATGKGHGTDRAVIAGLLGWRPESCDPVAFSGLLNDEMTYSFVIGPITLELGSQNIIFDEIAHDYPFSNTIIMRLFADERIVFEKEYYSVGGGFIQWKGWQEPEIGRPPFPYRTMKELKNQLMQSGIPLHKLMIKNEQTISGLSEDQIYDRMRKIVNVMEDAVKRGLSTRGTLPGTIKLTRKAPKVYEKASNSANSPDSFLMFLNAYCLAASEENAAGHLVVTAPTSGASGVIPGIVYLLKVHFQYRTKKIIDGLLAAAAIGFLVKHNASISGAEAGCMGEIGTAAGMAAAVMTYATGFNMDIIEAASEIALEHHLGMTCDPVGGYVQIPCIERNAVGAVKAYNAYLLASSGDPMGQKVKLDQVIKVMRETGLDMSKKYKETSQAGLALNLTEC